MESTDEKDINIGNRDRSKKISKSQSLKQEKKYKTRKEMVQLPDQKMASRYFNRSIQQNEPSPSAQTSSEGLLKDNADINQKSIPSAITILSYETEVTPLQLLQIGKDYFCLYRYVWHDNNRFTQGFIVKRDVFLKAVSENLFNSLQVSSLLFSGQLDYIQTISLTDSQQQYLLYSRQLSSPFQKIQIKVKAAKVTDLPGEMLVNFLAIAIYCLFFIGFLVFYRLGCRQLDLAQQQQDFISAVSHELKTPLTSIRMYGEMLRSGWVANDAKKQSYYDFIFFESERLSRLINNVLQLARLGHQQSSVDIAIMPVQTLFDKIKPRLEAQIEASSFTLNCVLPEQSTLPINIKVDEDAFFQIMINLVDNAIKFTNQADRQQIDIGVKASKKNKTVIFFIRDYGPGIKNNQLKKIFQLFYRSGDELTRTTPGTGIGLALVAQLVETMSAKISVENKQPGVEFQVKFTGY
jgi:signal transduction histidine kinase